MHKIVGLLVFRTEILPNDAGSDGSHASDEGCKLEVDSALLLGSRST